MADEPRRSGRATKGQHTKNLESSTEPAPKPKGKAKAKKQEEEEEENETVRCLCGAEDDDDDEGRNFTCCDSCNVWQHNDCMGLPLKYEPQEYYCEQCRPENHPRIVEALQRGEEAAAIAAQMREEVHSKKKGRKSKGARVSEVKEEPPSISPVQEQGKRKHTGDGANVQPTKVRKASTQVDEAASSTKVMRRSTLEAGQPAPTLSDIKSAGRQNTAQALKKKFGQVVKEYSSKGQYRIPDGHTSDSLGEKYAVLVEHAMFKNHCGTSADPTPQYKDQFRNITSNVGPNPILLWDLLDGSLAPDVLATMSAGDMATEEQKNRDKKIKEENERLAQLKEDQTARRIRRTHKGEEYVDDEEQPYSNDGNASESNARQISNSAEIEVPTKQKSEATKPPQIDTQDAPGPEAPGRSPAERRSSSAFNIQNVWSSVQSPTTDVRSPSQAQVPQYSERQTQSGNNDADIDRLLEEDGAESAPYSPTEAGVDPSVIWRGKIDMPSVPTSIAYFDARAYHVAGSNLESRDRLAAIFPSELALGGRIAADKADEYLTSLSAAMRTDVSVLNLVPDATDGKSQAEFAKLFDYLQQRHRFGVVREPHQPPVRDVYIIPLEQGSSTTPAFLKRLDYNVIEEPRPHRILLVVFVIRYKTPPASAQTTPTAVAAPPNSAMSPTAPGSRASNPAQQHVTMRAPSQTAPGALSALSPTSASNGQGPHTYPQPQSSATNTPSHQIPENPYVPLPQQQSPPQNHPPPPPLNASAQQQQQSPASDMTPLARNILGEYYDCPTAQQLINQISMNQDSLQQLRKVFENSPETRTDFLAFQRALSSGS